MKTASISSTGQSLEEAGKVVLQAWEALKATERKERCCMHRGFGCARGWEGIHRVRCLNITNTWNSASHTRCFISIALALPATQSSTAISPFYKEGNRGTWKSSSLPMVTAQGSWDPNPLSSTRASGSSQLWLHSNALLSWQAAETTCLERLLLQGHHHQAHTSSVPRGAESPSRHNACLCRN